MRTESNLSFMIIPDDAITPVAYDEAAAAGGNFSSWFWSGSLDPADRYLVMVGVADSENSWSDWQTPCVEDDLKVLFLIFNMPLSRSAPMGRPFIVHVYMPMPWLIGPL